MPLSPCRWKTLPARHQKSMQTSGASAMSQADDLDSVGQPLPGGSTRAGQQRAATGQGHGTDAWQDQHSAGPGQRCPGVPSGPPRVPAAQRRSPGRPSPGGRPGRPHPARPQPAARAAPPCIDRELEAISGSLDGEDLYIHNEVHRCRGLRKLHLETARLGAGLQILHCVFFPGSSLRSAGLRGRRGGRPRGGVRPPSPTSHRSDAAAGRRGEALNARPARRLLPGAGTAGLGSDLFAPRAVCAARLQPGGGAGSSTRWRASWP